MVGSVPARTQKKDPVDGANGPGGLGVLVHASFLKADAGTLAPGSSVSTW